MDVERFIDDLQRSPHYADQIVHVRTVPPRAGRYADPREPLPDAAAAMLRARNIERLYVHQSAAIDAVRDGRDIVVVTGTASGKSLCYQVPLLEMLANDPDGRALLLFPTKALTQDQHRSFRLALEAAGMGDVLTGVYDGDTPADERRALRDKARCLFTNPDMLHASLLPQHGRWADLLGNLRLLVVDELHVYSGIFGSNAANLFRRVHRVLRHYASRPRVIACSATIANPAELAKRVLHREAVVIEDDAAPRGARTYVFWNPPRIRGGDYRSRRSANVEAHELFAELLRRNAPSIVFSKAKMTAEMIHRYACDALRRTAPHLVGKVTPYRGGYRPEERREIERRLFGGELLGVSATRALELGIDVGALEAAILVGYPGTIASFLQQTGRAGRRDRDALAILVGLDTAINQYILTHPEYILDRPVEHAVLDPDNPFIITGHLRCATHELPLPEAEAMLFGPFAPLVLRILQENAKVRLLGGSWYHAASETPQHEVSLRDTVDSNVLIHDVQSGAVLGEVNEYDAEPILHPGAIYIHRGDTYRVLELDMERRLAYVQREEVDYYTQPMGGTDVHHVDHRLREKPFGTGWAYWGEVTAYFNTHMYERVHFYELDAISRHGLELPVLVLETMAVWLVPSEALMERVRQEGLNVHSGLRGIGYAIRMLLPLYMTCDTLDFSHSIGSANSPWNAIFIYERYPRGLGFTEKAYEMLHRIVPDVLDVIRRCECEEGCPCCVGKPLRGYTTWNPERGEGSIPSKEAARMILEGLLEDGGNLQNPDTVALTDGEAGDENRLEQELRRRLERMREPRVFHPINPQVRTEYPEIEAAVELPAPDVAKRNERRTAFEHDLKKKLAKKLKLGGKDPLAPRAAIPRGMKPPKSNLPPTAFPGRPAEGTGLSGIQKGSRDAGDAGDGGEVRVTPPDCVGGVSPKNTGAGLRGTKPSSKSNVTPRTQSGGVGKELPSAGPPSAEGALPNEIRLGDDLASRAWKRLRKGKGEQKET